MVARYTAVLAGTLRRHAHPRGEKTWASFVTRRRFEGGNPAHPRGTQGITPTRDPDDNSRIPAGKRANAKKEILVEQNDLHHNNKKPLEDLLYNLHPTTDSEAGRALYYEQLSLYPWRLLVERSIQHFGNHRGSEGADCAHAVDGHYEMPLATIGHKCLRCVPARSRHSLESFLAGRLAMIPSEMLRSAGQSHPDTFYTDCTHFCQPGPQDALAATLSQIIVEYKTATTFFERVTNSSYWRQAHEAQRLLYRPNETLRLPSCPNCD